MVRSRWNSFLENLNERSMDQENEMETSRQGKRKKANASLIKSPDRNKRSPRPFEDMKN